MNLSDRIALFNNGRIEQVGTPEALYQAPETLFAARFLGDSNVFESSSPVDGKLTWEDNVWEIDATTVSAQARPDAPAALVVRPEDIRIATDERDVPPGANAVTATVRDLAYLGSYRTAVLALGRSGVIGRVRLDALDSTVQVGQSVHAWWRVERQRLVAS